MEAYTEWLYQPPLIVPDAIGLIRIGPNTRRMPDPYEVSTVFVIHNGIIIPKGANNPRQCPHCGMHIHLSKSHVVAGLREMRNITGRGVYYIHKGKEMFMAAHKKQLAHASACANSDGSANWPEIMAQGTALHEQEAAGHVKVQNYTVTQTDVPGGKRIIHDYVVLENK